MRSPLDLAFGALGGFILAVVMFAGGALDSKPAHPASPAPIHVIDNLCAQATEVGIYQHANGDPYFGIKFVDANNVRYDLTWQVNGTDVAVEKAGYPLGTEPLSASFNSCTSTKPHVPHEVGQ